MKHRVNSVFKNVEEDVDAIVIQNATHPHVDLSYFYVTGLKKGVFEGCAAILYPDGSLEVISSLLEEESARKGDFEVSAFKTKEERKKIISEKLSGFKRIGFNSTELVYKDFQELDNDVAPEAKFVDVSEGISKARAVKDDEEIEILRKACKITSEVAEEIVEVIKEGVKEYEVAAELSYLMQKKGATGPGFDTIASFGANSAEPHYTCGDVILKKGDFILLDFGAKYQLYSGDITRTFVFGKASDKQKKIYETVLKAQAIALDMIKAGVKGTEVHKAVSEFIDSTEFKGRFIHGTGHQIGLSVHDGAALTKTVEVDLKENMVCTVEPGIYFPGYGGVRIEDDVLIKKDGIEILTSARKDLIEL